LTRYRFVIGVGELFNIRDVRIAIEKFLKCSEDSIETIIDKSLQKEIEELKQELSKEGRYAIYVFPNSKIDYIKESDGIKEFKDKLLLYKNSIDYSISLNYAVLNYAARHKDEVLMNMYKMGKAAIDAGNKDNWTLSPNKVEMLNEQLKADKRDTKTDSIAMQNFAKVYKAPALRDPRGYIIPANQTSSAVAFVNILIQSGIKVHKASSDFVVNGKNYGAGSYVVKTNQAFRAHVLDMFDPQDHPNDFLYP
jgi:hypothetical protein